MKKIIAFLVIAYIFFASWTEAYKLSDFLRLPYIPLILMASLYFLKTVIKGKINTQVIKAEDTFLYLAIFFMIFSLAIKGGNSNYVIAYFFTLFIGYVVFKTALFEHVKFKTALKYNAWAILFVAVFVNIEFFVHYYLDINIRDLLMFGDVKEATYLGIYNRAYGFSTEPTNLGFYFNSLGLLGLKYWNENIRGIKKIVVSIFIIFAWIFTFSASTFAGLLIGVFLTIIITSNKKITISRKRPNLFFLLTILVTIILIVYNQEIIKYVEPILNKLTLIGQRNQSYSRINLWIRDLERFAESPILGHGPGSTTMHFGGSSVNWYLTYLVENGILATIPIFIFIVSAFIRVLSSRNSYRNIFLISFVAALIHLATISTFYDPPFWILLSLFYVCEEKYIMKLE